MDEDKHPDTKLRDLRVVRRRHVTDRDVGHLFCWLHEWMNDFKNRS